MAKKQNQDNPEKLRQTRKDMLKARKQDEGLRTIRIGVGIVVSLLAAILIFAVVNEFWLAPNRAVAIVKGEEISLRLWQERVELERAQRILVLENQLEAFNNDVGVVQQFAGQAINDLLQTETLGQNALDAMINEVVIRQAAEVRGIMVTEADIDEAIGATFNYFDGGLPTALPEPTETIEPTPSITPIPTAVITDVLPTTTPFPTAEPGPTGTPAPTATAVSKESFDEQLDDILSRLQEMGVSEATYRESIRNQLYREQLQAALTIESELSQEDEHANFFILSFGTEEEANEAKAMIDADSYLPVWNRFRSNSFDSEGESTANASESGWVSSTSINSGANPDLAAAIFDTPLNESSDIIVQPVDAETNQYFIIMVSGREVRPLSESEYQGVQQQNLQNFISQQQIESVEFTGFDEGRTPTQPVLDPLFTQPPTPDPLAVPIDDAGGTDTE